MRQSYKRKFKKIKEEEKKDAENLIEKKTVHVEIRAR
jgi:hypothetical protein